MKRISFLTVLLLGVLFAPAQKTITDPNAEVRPAKDFHGISISNAFDVYLTQANDEAVAVSASEKKYRDMITVEVRNGVLFIGIAKGGLKWLKGNKDLKAYISFKQIDRLGISGASDVYVQGTIKLADLKMDLSGASNLKGRIEIPKLVIDLSGASDMTVNGTVGQLTINASGASKFKGEDLQADFCKAHASGASDIKITVNKELSAQASGASDVRYKGSGVITDIKTSGASRITKI